MPRDALRVSHLEIVLNDKSGPMERRLDAALAQTVKAVKSELNLTLVQESKMDLDYVVSSLNTKYEAQLGMRFQREFRQHARTWLKPDGGFWYVAEWRGPRRWVLVAEAKRQGTNDARAAEGLPKQARGNAIERLGKNMRGFQALFAGEEIYPFVCFGEGCDFCPESSILDRVATLNLFFPLRQIFVEKVPLPGGTDVLNPGSLFFREESWTPAEMADVMLEVCRRSIRHYQGKYGL